MSLDISEFPLHCWIPAPPKSPTPYIKAHIISHNSQTYTYEFEDSPSSPMESPISTLQPHNPLNTAKLFNLLDLKYANPSEILNNLYERYKEDQIQTNLGNSLLIINPLKTLSSEYSPEKLRFFCNKLKNAMISKKFEDFKDPHIFSKAAHTYFSLAQTQKNQAIIIQGIAGSGKTETIKLAMKFLANFNNSDLSDTSIEEKIISTIPILESFGNARTLTNPNSSRFGEFIRILIEKSGMKIQGAAISSYLLEKSRVSSHPDCERNYHIFYQILEGLTSEEKSQFLLDLNNVSEDFAYLRCKDLKEEDKERDFQDYKRLLGSLKTINFTNEEFQAILAIIFSILYLGNLNFKDPETQDKPCLDINSEFSRKIASLLHINHEKLLENLLYKTRTIEKDVIKSPLNLNEILGLRDSLARGMYDQLFNWLMKRLNLTIIPKTDVNENIPIRKSLQFLRKSLNNPTSEKLAIGLLDIFGFEDLPFNGFEQFCINFLSEKLHQMYLIETFKLEKRIFQDEEIMEFSGFNDFYDNQLLLDLFEKYPLGLFQLLDESTALASNDDKKLLEKIIKTHAEHPNFIKPKAIFNTFSINHYGNSVQYDIHGFRNKNKDEIPKELQETIEESENTLISNIFRGFCGFETEKVLDYKKKFKEKQGNLSKKKNEKFLGAKFRNEIQQLIEEMNTYDISFVRCLKPNITNIPNFFDFHLIFHQLKGMEVFNTVKLRKEGFCYKKKYQDFLKEFGGLLVGDKEIMKNDDFKEKSRKLLKRLNKDMYLEGNTRVFIRYEGFLNLEEELKRLRNRNGKKILKKLILRKMKRKGQNVKGFEEKIRKFQRIWKEKRKEKMKKMKEEKKKAEEKKDLEEIKEEEEIMVEKEIKEKEKGGEEGRIENQEENLEKKEEKLEQENIQKQEEQKENKEIQENQLEKMEEKVGENVTGEEKERLENHEANEKEMHKNEGDKKDFDISENKTDEIINEIIKQEKESLKEEAILENAEIEENKENLLKKTIEQENVQNEKETIEINNKENIEEIENKLMGDIPTTIDQNIPKEKTQEEDKSTKIEQDIKETSYKIEQKNNVEKKEKNQEENEEIISQEVKIEEENKYKEGNEPKKEEIIENQAQEEKPIIVNEGKESIFNDDHYKNNLIPEGKEAPHEINNEEIVHEEKDESNKKEKIETDNKIDESSIVEKGEERKMEEIGHEEEKQKEVEEFLNKDKEEDLIIQKEGKQINQEEEMKNGTEKNKNDFIKTEEIKLEEQIKEKTQEIDLNDDMKVETMKIEEDFQQQNQEVEVKPIIKEKSTNLNEDIEEVPTKPENFEANLFPENQEKQLLQEILAIKENEEEEKKREDNLEKIRQNNEENKREEIQAEQTNNESPQNPNPDILQEDKDLLNEELIKNQQKEIFPIENKGEFPIIKEQPDENEGFSEYESSQNVEKGSKLQKEQPPNQNQEPKEALEMIIEEYEDRKTSNSQNPHSPLQNPPFSPIKESIIEDQKSSLEKRQPNRQILQKLKEPSPNDTPEMKSPSQSPELLDEESLIMKLSLVQPNSKRPYILSSIPENEEHIQQIQSERTEKKDSKQDFQRKLSEKPLEEKKTPELKMKDLKLDFQRTFSERPEEKKTAEVTKSMQKAMTQQIKSINSARFYNQSSDLKLEAEMQKLSLEKSLRKSILLSPREPFSESKASETLNDALNEFLDENEILNQAIEKSHECIEIYQSSSPRISSKAQILQEYRPDLDKDTSLLDLFLQMKVTKSALNINTFPFCSDLNIDMNSLDREFIKLVISHPFQQFAEKYLPKRTTWSGKSIPIGELLSFSPKPKLGYPLTPLNKANEKLAFKSFKLIINYLYEKDEENGLEIAKELLTMVFSALDREEFKNEVFLQILKQTRRCPDEILATKAYILLILFASVFKPANVFLFPIFQHLYTAIQTNQKTDENQILRALNKACFMRILRVFVNGERKKLPNIKELKIISRVKKIIIQVILPNNWERFISVPIEPYTTVFEAKALLLKFLDLHENQEYFGLFSIINKNGELEEIFLEDQEKYMDILDELETQKEDFETRVYQGKSKGFNKLWFFDYRIVLKIRLFFKLWENDVDGLNFYYLQHQGDFLNGKFANISETDLYLLATFSLLIAYDIKLDNPLEIKVLTKLLPRNPIKPFNLNYILENVKSLIEKFKDLSKKELKLQYLDILRKYEGFMTHGFLINYRQINKKNEEIFKGHLRLLIRPLQIFFMDEITNKCMKGYRFEEIKEWGINKGNLFIVMTEDGFTHVCETNQGKWMEYLVKKYSKMALGKD